MASIAIKKINDCVGPAPKFGGEDKRPARAAYLFSDPFSNVFLSAKKKSGKTSCLAMILKKIMSSKTRLIIISSTVNKDPIMMQIVKDFEKKGVEVEKHTSIIKDDGSDLLDDIVKQYEADAEHELARKKHEEATKAKLGKQAKTILGSGLIKISIDGMSGEGPKEKKSKYLERKAIIVLDDISNELKSKSLVTLLKKSRHFHLNIFMSSQYYLDLLPESRTQIDYYLLYKGIAESPTLEKMYKDGNPSIDWPTFLALYHNATAKPYSFFYAGVRSDDYRKNFNEQYDTEAAENNTGTDQSNIVTDEVKKK